MKTDSKTDFFLSSRKKKISSFAEKENFENFIEYFVEEEEKERESFSHYSHNENNVHSNIHLIMNIRKANIHTLGCGNATSIRLKAVGETVAPRQLGGGLQLKA